MMKYVGGETDDLVREHGCLLPHYWSTVESTFKTHRRSQLNVQHLSILAIQESNGLFDLAVVLRAAAPSGAGSRAGCETAAQAAGRPNLLKKHPLVGKSHGHVTRAVAKLKDVV
jgi:hypothetical protein